MIFYFYFSLRRNICKIIDKSIYNFGIVFNIIMFILFSIYNVNIIIFIKIIR